MWYKVLGVSKKASEEEITKAYIKKLQDSRIAYDLKVLVPLRWSYRQGIAYANKTKKQKSLDVVAVIIFIIFSLILGAVFTNYFLGAKIFKDTPAQTSESVTDCLQYNFTGTKASYNYIEPYVKDAGYQVNEITATSFKATKNY